MAEPDGLPAERFVAKAPMITRRVSLTPFMSRWTADGGYRPLLAVAVPLIISNGAFSVQQFIDRMFLAWFSPEAMAAATPSGILNFTIMSLFINTVSYASTFVAQYHGAGRIERIGPVIRQTVYLSLAGAVIMAAVAPLATPIFRLAGHGPAIAPLEIRYFQILCLGSVFPILTAGLSGFYAGQGRTWPVMWINLEVTGLNVILDYWLIFGGFGLPPMGIAGAAIATVAATGTGTIIMAGFIFLRRDRLRFRLNRDGYPQTDDGHKGEHVDAQCDVRGHEALHSQAAYEHDKNSETGNIDHHLEAARDAVANHPLQKFHLYAGSIEAET